MKISRKKLYKTTSALLRPYTEEYSTTLFHKSNIFNKITFKSVQDLQRVKTKISF